MFGRIHLWCHLVLDFCFRGIYYRFNFITGNLSAYTSFLPGSTWGDSTFLWICPFLLDCPLYWFLVDCSNLLLLATHSNTLAWKIPWMEEPSRLQSMGSWRVGHDWLTSLSLFTFMHWRRKWQPTPEFLPGESQGRGSLVGCRLWGCTESDTTEAT